MAHDHQLLRTGGGENLVDVHGELVGELIDRRQWRPIGKRMDRTHALRMQPSAQRRQDAGIAKHAVQRAYVAVVEGSLTAQTIDTWLVRDRGDGLRGSTPQGSAAEGAQHAITHVRPMEQFGAYSVVECRLETGRTHQIRIHLSEIGHRLCGEKTYTHALGQKAKPDASGAPRQALHAAELAFAHPISGQALRFRMPLPTELKEWLLRLQKLGG